MTEYFFCISVCFIIYATRKKKLTIFVVRKINCMVRKIFLVGREGKAYLKGRIINMNKQMDK